MTPTPTLAQRIASDIVATADQYPAIRDARSFSALHDIYDANESIIAAIEAHTGRPFHVNAMVNESNEATDLIDRILRADGFERLRVFATARIVSLDIPATFGAEIVIDDSDPANPVVVMIQTVMARPSRYIVTPGYNRDHRDFVVEDTQQMTHPLGNVVQRFLNEEDANDEAARLNALCPTLVVIVDLPPPT